MRMLLRDRLELILAQLFASALFIVPLSIIDNSSEPLGYSVGVILIIIFYQIKITFI